VKFGLDLPTSGAYADAKALAGLAVDAEAAGWDGVFLQDTFSGDAPVCDPWIAMALVAASTSRIRLGVLMTAFPRRRPWQIARHATTLDHLSGGRLIVGAALGYAEQDFTPFGEPWDLMNRARMLDEGLDVVTGVWSGQPYTFEGSHYTLRDALLGPPPLQQPRIPIWVAAGWPNRGPLHRGAKWDGVYLMTVHQRSGEYLRPDDVRDATRALSSLREPGRPAAEVAFNPPPGAGEAAVRGYAAAGATWWIELDHADAGPSRHRERIRRGPPDRDR
jgi:alkanesulfonate monooxygenase SsuD/methylene tetrahydromethanopterin reductase-like flavin-dependent oxidoreductase (luciferase family)